MADNAMFKSALYGFNKEDVLEYIENLENENQKNDTQLLDALKKIEELEQKLLSQNQTTQELYLENKQYQNKLTNFNKDQSVSSILNKDAIEMEAIKAENEELKSTLNKLKCECKRFKNIEDKFQSVVLDAYVYSGSILDDAAQRAEQIAKGSKDAIKQVAGDMGDLSSYVNNISKEFSQIVSGLTDDIKGVTENLMSVTKNFQQENNEDNEEISSIENYIDSSIEQIVNSNLSYSDTDIAENISDFDDYIKVFETLISGESESEELIEESDVFVQNQTKVTNELISQYASEENLDETPQDVNSDSVEANFISSQPIGSAVEEDVVAPLNPVVRLDENFKMQDGAENFSQNANSKLDHLEGEGLTEDFVPLHGGMDYSSFLQTGGEVKYNTDENQINLQEPNKSEKNLDAEVSSDENTQEINMQKIESKGVEIELDEPVMLDLDGGYSEEPEKSSFGKIKLKIKKDK
ncbi:MAG: DivIVA domain-containing protein [Acutalibacteraceae bacterium]